MSAFYNENDPKMAAWLRELIKRGLIADGIVDERSICDIKAEDLNGYAQIHFFAGIGGWPHALRLAGWPDGFPVWTGSCPCQPFSIAQVAHGGAKGHNDSRDLWPTFAALIRESRPAIIFGEQVIGAIQWGWWDRAALDLERAGYACGAAILQADAVGASHQRKRFYFVADSSEEGWEGYKQVECFSVSKKETFAVNGDPLAGARCALAGDYSDLLPCNGLSVQVERDAIDGYGNAIAPQVAAEFIKAFLEAKACFN